MTVHTSSPIEQTVNSAPTASKREGFSSRELGSRRTLAASATAIRGILTRNIECQEKCCNSAPPLTGPITTASPDTADQMPMAVARSPRSVKIDDSSASVAGETTAAETPMIAKIIAQGRDRDEALARVRRAPAA